MSYSVFLVIIRAKLHLPCNNVWGFVITFVKSCITVLCHAHDCIKSHLPYRDIDEDVQSVKQFTSELIVEAVVRCLRVIDPSLGNGLSHSLPPGMSARFRLGMSLAQACQVRDTVLCLS